MHAHYLHDFIWLCYEQDMNSEVFLVALKKSAATLAWLHFERKIESMSKFMRKILEFVVATSLYAMVHMKVFAWLPYATFKDQLMITSSMMKKVLFLPHLQLFCEWIFFPFIFFFLPDVVILTFSCLTSMKKVFFILYIQLLDVQALLS